MKRVFFFLSFLLMSCIIMAQEKAQDMGEVVDDSGIWSTETKMTPLAIWGLIVVILTVRTFRNKADM